MPLALQIQRRLHSPLPMVGAAALPSTSTEQSEGWILSFGPNLTTHLGPLQYPTIHSSHLRLPCPIGPLGCPSQTSHRCLLHFPTAPQSQLLLLDPNLRCSPPRQLHPNSPHPSAHLASTAHCSPRQRHPALHGCLPHDLHWPFPLLPLFLKHQHYCHCLDYPIAFLC